MDKATPWEIRPHEFDDWGFIRDAYGNFVCQARWPYMPEAELHKHRINKTDPSQERAALIVKAVNSHDALVGALEAVLLETGHSYYGGNPSAALDFIEKRCRAALKSAKGEA